MTTTKTITVEQTGSATGRPDRQRKSLIGLGLTRIGRRRTLEDTPSVRGLIAKVPHTRRWNVSRKGHQVLGAVVRLYHHGIPAAVNQAA